MGEKQAEEKNPQKKEGEISAVSQIPIEDIEPNSLFALDEKDPSFKLLTDDISKRGLLEPITLNKKADGKYEVIDGNRRLAAMKKLGVKTINAFVANFPDKLKGKAQIGSNKRHPADNIILTENVQMSMDSRRHRRNLNVLVVGGSGAGKTRFYAKPNVMQANTSYLITDPKGSWPAPWPRC